MEKNNNIGLKNKDVTVLSEKLNELLANYQFFYMNTRGFHWNIKGDKFFELHVKFEELYTDSQIKIDEIAERILTLGQTPLHTFEDFSKVSKIKAAKNISNGVQAIKSILEAYEVLLPLERELLQLAGDSNDEGTSSLMSDYIGQQEKLIWMYSAFVAND